jgi:cell division septation protein DedD
MNTGLRRFVAGTAVLGATAAIVLTSAAAASAMPTDFRCTSAQVDTTLVPGSPGAGQRYALVKFTAKPGVTCNFQGSLPVSLAGAPGITVVNEGGDAPLVTISDGQSATMLLHWTGIESPENQVQPASVTVVAPSDTDPRGVTSDPHITLPWNQGPMDDSAQAHELIVGPVTAA